MDSTKCDFIQALEQARGIVKDACAAVGISRKTYYNWRDSDPEFKAAADMVKEDVLDYVESKLLDKVEAGDNTSIIFYLKCQGQRRGWIDKPQPAPAPAQPTPAEALEATGKARRRKVKVKKDWIVKLLKQRGKYTAELTAQVTIAAQLLVRVEEISEEMMAAGSKAVTIEYSREGNERAIVSPAEKLFLDYTKQAQLALRALGMNTDAKDGGGDDSAASFGEFVRQFKDDND